MILLVQTIGGVFVVMFGVRAVIMVIGAMRRMAFEQERRRLAVELLREKVATAMADKVAANESANLTWAGYRKFEIVKKDVEADNIASFYLVPHNRRSLPPFKPGQYLTFRLEVPGRAKPLVRCYSLSDGPDPETYRITVKRIPAPRDRPDLSSGVGSTFLHESVAKGTLLDVMAPTGHFFIDESTDRPAVLIAGGIGLTPLLSMLNSVAKSGRRREIWLFYGVRDKAEEVLSEHLRTLDRDNEDIHVRISHSAPADGEIEGEDYDFGGRVSVELIREALPSSNYDFFVCGPSAMMSTIIADLRDWDVPEERLHFEAFGAASVQQVVGAEGADTATEVAVEFERSGKRFTWRPDTGTILDLADKHGVAIDYGCRAGNCGTCVTAVRSGAVTYLSEPGAEVESGTCLTCISIPKSSLVLDA